jgi:hypothetical protein
MAQRRNLYLKRIKQLDAHPTKALSDRRQRMISRKGRVFSTLTKKSLGRRVMLRASYSLGLSSNAHASGLTRANPLVYNLEAWKYQQPKWAWKNPSAVPGLLKLQKLKWLALHRRYALAILNQWMYHRSRRTWVRWLQQLQWQQWAWVQRLEHLPHQLLTKVGWFDQPKEAMLWFKAGRVQLNAFPKGKLRVNSFTTQPGDVWQFAFMPGYHQHLSRHAHWWTQQWAAPLKASSHIYL